MTENKERKNELVEFFFNIGDIIKLHRIKKRMRIKDVCQKIKEKYGEEIHPSILSRYENKKLAIKNTHMAYLFDVLEIYLEDVFINRIIVKEVNQFVGNLKFQYLIRHLQKFFTNDEISKMIQDFLEERLNFVHKLIHIYEHKFLHHKNISENDDDL